MWAAGGRAPGVFDGLHEPFLIRLSYFWAFFCIGLQRMATAQQLPPPAAKPHVQPAAAVNPAAIEPVSAAPEPPAEDNEDLGELKGVVTRLPVELDIAIPVRDFRVHNLLALAPGVLIESRWSNGEDLPLAAGEVQLAWTEFEVVETQLAVRITRLA